ncbi:class I SAM-dependent methyltransferase [Microbaculum marinum]|uniref:Class I SAM-dependent methyltransferase n=1 Tax=Microbaculum marinum TaxID=1764581 RepID=A0AAW9RP67_9HYPH
MTVEYDETGKIVLDHVYNQPDPIAYFSTLSKLDYSIPGEAAPVFRKVIEAWRGGAETDEVNLLDLGCSYGINAAILKHDLSMGDLYTHYAGAKLAGLSEDDLIEHDRQFYAKHLADPDLAVTGVDIAANAIDYAVQAQMLDDGFTANLETGPLPATASEAVGDANLVISTGCVGYVRQATFEKILEAGGDERPWMAHFVLRMFPYEEFEDLLAGHGYVTETLPATFRQRRFASAEERDHVLSNLSDLGLDAAGKEADGWYHANFHLSRPAEAVEAMPLREMIPH